MGAHRNLRLGGDRASAVLRGVGLLPKALRGAAETEFFADPDLVVAKTRAVASLFSGGQRVGLKDFNIPVVSNAVAGTVSAYVPQMFLFLKVDWLGNGTDVSYYSQIDRPNGRHQILGKILKVGSFDRAYGANRNLQRLSGVTLRLEDLDRSIATRVRAKASDGKTGQYNYTRFYFSVGEISLTEDYYAPIGTVFKVQRATITETAVEFSLIDASDDVLLAVIQPPTINSLISNKAWPSAGTRMKMSATTNTGFDWSLGDATSPNAMGIAVLATPQQFATMNDDGGYAGTNVTITPATSNVAPVPFCGWTKAPYAWGAWRNKIFATGSGQGTTGNPVGVVVLGASKNPNWMQPHFWGDCQNGAATKVRNEPMIYVRPRDGDGTRQLLGYNGEDHSWVPNGATGIGAYIDVHQVGVDSPTKLGEVWYVAVLYVYANTNVGKTDGSNYAAQLAMMKLALAAQRGEVYVDWLGIAASIGYQSSEKAVPAQVIGYLAQYHSFTLDRLGTPQERGVSALRGENRVIDNYDDALTADGLCGDVVGGAITEKMAGSTIADQICATAMLDQSYTPEGRLALRPAGITGRDRALAIPRAREITDNDIIDGIWKEYAPKGDDRWGWGNVYTYDGVQDVAKIKEWNGEPARITAGNPPAGQVVERTVPIYWKRQDPRQMTGDINDIQAAWLLPYQTERQTAEFELTYGAAAGLALGEFLYVTTYAASNADGSKGWDRKLCRVERLNVPGEPGGPVGIGVVTMDAQLAKMLLLDDENRWTALMPRNLDTFTCVAGNTTVTFNPSAGTPDRLTSSLVNCIFKICPAYNPKPYPAADFATYAVSSANSFASKVASVTDGTHLVLANAAPVNGTFYAWRIKYSHVNPPPAAAFAGTLASSAGDPQPWTWYAQLADSTTGQFSNGDPAQVFPGP